MALQDHDRCLMEDHDRCSEKETDMQTRSMLQ